MDPQTTDKPRLVLGADCGSLLGGIGGSEFDGRATFRMRKGLISTYAEVASAAIDGGRRVFGRTTATSRSEIDINESTAVVTHHRLRPSILLSIETSLELSTRPRQ